MQYRNTHQKCKIYNTIDKNGHLTVEELIIVKKLTKLLNNGVYKVIDELIKWYSKRRPEEKTEYYKLMEDKIYYNLII